LILFLRKWVEVLNLLKIDIIFTILSFKKEYGLTLFLKIFIVKKDALE
jgi:hypothetical protein